MIERNNAGKREGTARMIAPTNILDLSGHEPIASGTYRDVYLFPGRPEAVVKVLRNGAAIRPGRRIRNFLKGRSIKQRYRFMFREYEAYLEAKLNSELTQIDAPISELLWLQQTSRGLGMVAERTRGKDDGLAHSLGDLIRDGSVGAEIVSYLNAFIADLNGLDIIANDTNPENLLLDESGDKPRFVLVDGFGDPSPLRVKRWSATLRQRARDRRCELLASQVGCVWDGTSRRLVM